ncbi:aspartate/glutamate racemase family protein [Neobacillus drentensis]|uniref:aspartate/glutamate racemase family protein n=1 Tax=Neobacillus drentensis TaxID=220684 RepID=UPI002FFDC2A1
MKTIGLIGGLSWESTSEYYSYINRFVKEKLGGLHSAKCLLHSFDFQEMVDLQHKGDWDQATNQMIHAAKTLENGGADMIVICTNTMHKMAPEVKNEVKIPLLHIVDAVAEKINEQSMTKVGLLGTKFTMEQPFYKEYLSKHGIEVIIPNEEDRKIVHDVIYNELCKGDFKEASKDKYIQIINRLYKQGAEGIILGCTEIPLLVKQEDTFVPLFDSTLLHAKSAVDFAFK